MKTEKYCIVSTTVETEEIANKITTALLQAKLVACVQSHTIQSSYHWNNNIEKSDEIILQMKTRSIHFEAIKTSIETLHSYEVPEIIMTPIMDANKDYLEWIDKEVK